MDSLSDPDLAGWTVDDCRTWLYKILDEHADREMRSGYDEKLGLMAISMLRVSVQRCDCTGLNDVGSVLCGLTRAMFDAYIHCDLEGEYSSGRSSMGSVFYDLLARLPPVFESLRLEWEWVRQHEQFPAPDMIAATTSALGPDSCSKDGASSRWLTVWTELKRLFLAGR